MAPTTFLILPPELRDEIYELSFASNIKAGSKTDLRHKDPPSKALLLVSREIYNEAGKIYREAYRGYWKNEQFTLDLIDRPLSRQGCKLLVLSVKPTDLAHLRNLEITATRTLANYEAILQCIRISGGWKCVKTNAPERTIFVSITRKDRKMGMEKRNSAAEVEEAVKHTDVLGVLDANELAFLLLNLVRY